MAISSHQLYMLKDKRFERDIWMYRAKALRGFQHEIARFRDDDQSSKGWEQVIATLIMLTFFDMSQDASPAWLIHQRCARNIQALLPITNNLSMTQLDLFRFFRYHFAQHEAFARTAYDILDPHAAYVCWFPHGLEADMTIIDALLGCSPELISLILEISNLAAQRLSVASTTKGNFESNSRRDEGQAICAWRNNIERRLYFLEQVLPCSPSLSIGCNQDGQGAIEELGYIAETRRLSALLYMYSRLDHIPPGFAPIDKLTTQILALIPKISLRSHALLWPLFVVGTMGIGVVNPESGDAQRIFVLERLVSLQQTRQLKNVRRAREIVEFVWKMRDLQGPEYMGGWYDIGRVGSYGVSLC
ncbi:unnamed protein product [Clonostachys chloroleuca]|uniref:Uncharacterized protein n=1 Tax=Clonostachys chloroleuca TaxID=1926264 RepID=A0AA35LYB7_9HYPO|nr:unnamed protein product [Clonostachys chloroleuca]